jgi:trimeric autotransporter adhesin
MNLIFRSALPATVLLLACDLACAPALSAQSDLLLRLRSGSPAGERFYVDSAGAFVARGILGIGTPPAAGAGLRTMWYPWRGGFRTGEALADEWDHANFGFYSFAGGLGTRARGIYAISYGNQNVADAQASVALGQANVVHGTSPNFANFGVALGRNNVVWKQSGVAIGWEATAGRSGTSLNDGDGAVAIGRRVSAITNYSMALGVRAQAQHAGAFVWGSTTSTGAVPTDSIRSSAVAQFSVRAVGGIRMFSNQAMTTGVFVSANSSSWSSVSDRHRKENFAPVDGEDVLRRLRDVPVSTWTFIDVDDPVRHIGPMAQDWHAAFGLKPDSLLIDRGDIDGVSLAAIQALEARTAAQAERIRELEARQDRQAAEIAELRAVVRAMAEARAP